MQKSRAMKSGKASKVKRAGHRDEKAFARLIQGKIVSESPQPKADVVDRGGNAFSVKSGAQKWQIFLYGRNRLMEDAGFGAINGIGELLAGCIDAFPETYAQYRANKQEHKARLREPMRAIKDKLRQPPLLERFLEKSLFNGKVDFLAVKSGAVFHVFHKSDVLDVLSGHVCAENSRARARGQTSEQKVVFKSATPRLTTLGEIEMRADSPRRFRQVKFWMYKNKTLSLLRRNITASRARPDGKIIHYGAAVEKLAEDNNAG